MIQQCKPITDCVIRVRCLHHTVSYYSDCVCRQAVDNCVPLLPDGPRASRGHCAKHSSLCDHLLWCHLWTATNIQTTGGEWMRGGGGRINLRVSLLFDSLIHLRWLSTWHIRKYTHIMLPNRLCKLCCQNLWNCRCSQALNILFSGRVLGLYYLNYFTY